MAVVYGAIGTTGSTTATTTVTAAYPTGISAATSKLYLVVTGRSATANTSAAVTGGGWTQVGAFEGGVGTWGVDTGTRRVEVWRKDTVTGSETGNVTVTLGGTTTNTLYARIVRVEVPSGYGIAEQFVSGADTTAGTAFSATASSNATFTSNDLLLIAHAGTTDTSTQSAQAITASGITFGTRTNRATIAVTGGNDHRHVIDTVPVTTGSGTAVAPTYAYTGSASTSGPVGFVVLTEVPPPSISVQPTNQTVTEPATATFSVTASGATGYQWQQLAPGGGNPVFLGTETLTLSTSSTTPGPQSITVPAGTQGVVVMARANSSGLTLTSTFAGSWTSVTPSSGVERLLYAPVTATGAQTITPDWGSFLAEGPVIQLFYIGTIDNSSTAAWVRDANAGEVDNTSVASTINDLVIVMDTCSSTTGTFPGAASGWTTRGTPYNNGNVGARSRTADSPGDPTTSVTRVTDTGTAFHGLSVISIFSASWSNVTTGTGGATSSYTTAATTTALSGYQYRCVVTGPGGSTTSNAATLTVNAGGGGTDLVTQNSTHAHSADNVTLTTSTALAVNDAAHAHSADNIVLTSSTALVIADAAHAHAADNVTLSTGTALVVADSQHAHAADNLTLTSATALVVADAVQVHAADNVALSVNAVLATDNAQHAQTADNLTLSVAATVDLVVADAAHAHTAQSPTLTTASALAVDNATQAHSAQALSLTLDTTLATANAAHAQSADNVTLSTTGGTFLTVADAQHAQAADNLALTSASSLAVQNAQHAHTADALTLGIGLSLVTASAAQTQAADNVALTLSTGLQVDSTAHGQSADNIALSALAWLEVADAWHVQTAQSPTLTAVDTTRIRPIEPGYSALPIDGGYNTLSIDAGYNRLTIDPTYWID